MMRAQVLFLWGGAALQHENRAPHPSASTAAFCVLRCCVGVSNEKFKMAGLGIEAHPSVKWVVEDEPTWART